MCNICVGGGPRNSYEEDIRDYNHGDGYATMGGGGIDASITKIARDKRNREYFSRLNLISPATIKAFSSKKVIDNDAMLAHDEAHQCLQRIQHLPHSAIVTVYGEKMTVAQGIKHLSHNLSQSLM